MLCDQHFSDAPGIENCHPNPVLSDETSLNTAVKVTIKPNSCIMETGPLRSSHRLPFSPLHLLPHPSLPLLALSLFCLFHLSMFPPAARSALLCRIPPSCTLLYPSFSHPTIYLSLHSLLLLSPSLTLLFFNCSPLSSVVCNLWNQLDLVSEG